MTDRSTALRTSVRDALYPATPPAGGRAALIGPAVFLVGTAVALLRLPPSALDTLWAEDGAVFLRQALERGTADAVTQPYSGYLHGFPRLVAELATVLPLGWAGFVCSVAAAAVIGLAAWSVWTLAAGHLPSAWLRGGLAAAVVLLPTGGLEPAANVANSHFFLLFAAFWALVARRPGAVRQVVPTLVVVLAALSDPLAVILVPLAVGRLLVVRGALDRWVPAAYTAALAVQLSVALTADRGTGEPAPLADILFGYLLRVVTTGVVGLRGAAQILDVGGGAGIVVLSGVVLLVVVLGMLLPGRRLAVAAAAIASLAFYVVACLFALGRRYPPPSDGPLDLVDGSRYTVVPALLLLSALALTAQSVLERLPRRLAPVVVAAAALPLAVFLVLDFRAGSTIRGDTPAWSGQVSQAARACAEEPGHAVEIRIAPHGEWRVPIPCTVLSDTA
jgi:hypothetical protein